MDMAVVKRVYFDQLDDLMSYQVKHNFLQH